MRRQHAHDTVGSSRTQQQSPRCPVHAAPLTRLMPSAPRVPMESHADVPPPPPPMQRVPSPCTPPRLGSWRSTPAPDQGSMLPPKNVPMGSVAAHFGGSPMPPARRCLSKGTRMSLSSPHPPHAMSECALPGHSASSRLVEEPSSKHVA